MHWPCSNKKTVVFLSRQPTNFQTIWHEYLMCVCECVHSMVLNDFDFYYLILSTKILRFANHIHTLRLPDTHTHTLTRTLIRIKWMSFHVSAFRIFFMCVCDSDSSLTYYLYLCVSHNFFSPRFFLFIHFFYYYFLRNFMQIKFLFRGIIAIDKQRQIRIQNVLGIGDT